MMLNQLNRPADADLDHNDGVAADEEATHVLSKSQLIQKISSEPRLRYLDAYIRDPRWGNDAPSERKCITKNARVLKRQGDRWVKREWDAHRQPWEDQSTADGFVIIMDYLDSESVISLARLGIDVNVFAAHIDCCEQHYTGRWNRSKMSLPPYLRGECNDLNFVCHDYRRPYVVDSARDLAVLMGSQRQRCSLLRSDHLLRAADVVLLHERCTVAWTPKSGTRAFGIVGSEKDRKNFH